MFGKMLNLPFGGIDVKQIACGKKAVVILCEDGSMWRTDYESITMQSFQQSLSFFMGCHHGAVCKIAMHPDGNHLLALTEEGTFVVKANCLKICHFD